MTVPPRFPPEVAAGLEGWELAWFRLLPAGGAAGEMDRLRREVASLTAARAEDGPPGPVVQGVRRLFRAAGCDPTRHRPSSEALLRRVRKTGELPAIHPLVDLNNLVSLELMVPCCVIDAGAVAPPFELRVGRRGEAMSSLRGPFNLEGKPVLADRRGPFGTPITDAERVKVTPASGEVWLVAYLVSKLLAAADAEAVLRRLLAAAPVASLAS